MFIESDYRNGLDPYKYLVDATYAMLEDAMTVPRRLLVSADTRLLPIELVRAPAPALGAYLGGWLADARLPC